MIHDGECPCECDTDRDATTDECVECGEPVDDTGLPQRCALCVAYAEDLATIPVSTVPYGSGTYPSDVTPYADTHDYSDLLPEGMGHGC